MEFQGPNIVLSQIVFEYEQNLSIRKRVFDYEERLKDFFKVPFQVINVPENIDNSIPRFQSASIYGHSNLVATPIMLQLTTTYDKDYQTNLENIKTYITPRINALKDLVNDEALLYIGFIVEMSFKEPSNGVNEFLRINTGATAVRDDTLDFHLNYARPYKNLYYINITCAKYFEENNPKTNSFNNGISIRLDINSKYHFRIGKKFEPIFFEEVFNTSFNIIQNNTLQQYLKGEIL